MTKFLFLIILLILLIINIINGEEDECLYAIQRKNECFKIQKNNKEENCCYLEMDLNKITTTACIRVKNSGEEIEKRIFKIKENEEHYVLDNIIIECCSHYISFSIHLILIIIFFSIFYYHY